MTELMPYKCKKCGEECIKITIDCGSVIRPRRMSYCNGYHLNAFNPKTKICKEITDMRRKG